MIDSLVICLIIIGLLMVLFFMNRTRAGYGKKRDAIARKYNTYVADNLSLTHDLPHIFKLTLGKSKNYIKLREDLFLFEFHFSLLTAGNGCTDRFIQMVVDVQDTKNKEIAFIRDSLFMQWPDSYSITEGGYQCSYQDDELLRELKEKEISISQGLWGCIYIPNNGRINDIDSFLDEIDTLKNTLTKSL